MVEVLSSGTLALTSGPVTDPEGKPAGTGPSTRSGAVRPRAPGGSSSIRAVPTPRGSPAAAAPIVANQLVAARPPSSAAAVMPPPQWAAPIRETPTLRDDT